jgi:dTDP-4-dehydrorhamnose 3,5-epimerase-like enzyme
MGENRIKGVRTKKLRVIPNERGWLMEILRVNEEIGKKFGRLYNNCISRLKRRDIYDYKKVRP